MGQTLWRRTLRGVRLRGSNPIEELIALQDGVISRRQALAAGLSAPDVRRLLRRRVWVVMHPGVYVNHTGDPNWQQRAWAGVLCLSPAALVGPSALRSHEGPGRPGANEGPIHVGVDRDRNLREPEGILLTRQAHLTERVQWNASPPRQRYEDAALDVAAQARTDFDALEVLSRAVQSRRTTAARMLTTLDARSRSPRRDWLASVLADISQGTCSVLEHGYLTRVERPHGLDLGRRQVRAITSRGPVYRDVLYDNGRLIELDGRLFHDTTAQRDRDLDRDLEAVAAGSLTARVGWGQVFQRPCWTAERIGILIGVTATPCSEACEIPMPPLCG